MATIETTKTETAQTSVESTTGKRRGRLTREEAAAKKQRAEQSDFLGGCSLDERAYCVRLVRLLRDDYWMAELIRQILDKEAKSRFNWTIKGLQALLSNFDTIEALASNASALGANWSNHPVLRAIRKEWEHDEVAEYMGDRRVQRLIESAHKK